MEGAPFRSGPASEQSLGTDPLPLGVRALWPRSKTGPPRGGTLGVPGSDSGVRPEPIATGLCKRTIVRQGARAAGLHDECVGCCSRRRTCRSQ